MSQHGQSNPPSQHSESEDEFLGFDEEERTPARAGAQASVAAIRSRRRSRRRQNPPPPPEKEPPTPPAEATPEEQDEKQATHDDTEV